jgi:hypothetical protein
MLSTCNRVFDGKMLYPSKVFFLPLTLECYLGAMGNGDSYQVLLHPEPWCWGQLRAVGTPQLLHALPLSCGTLRSSYMLCLWAVGSPYMLCLWAVGHSTAPTCSASELWDTPLLLHALPLSCGTLHCSYTLYLWAVGTCTLCSLSLISPLVSCFECVNLSYPYELRVQSHQK